MKFVFWSFLLCSVCLDVCASDLIQVQKMLDVFDKDTKTFMDQIPPKKSQQHAVPIFSKSQVSQKQYIFAKNANRKIKGRAEFNANDDAVELVDNGNSMTTKIQDMEKITSAQLTDSPWSDYYWALVMGETAYRYADTKFPNDDKNYLKNVNFINTELERFDASSIAILSPAEKYDILVGDRDWTLTRSAMQAGKPYQDENKKVESWMGICHGWAPASFMLKRPRSVVKLKSADGKYDVEFYPADIKALASSLWAKAQAGQTVRFIGGRCDVKNPAKDTKGRVTDANCFDTNPGTWHLAVVNQIGISKRSFIIDATFDYEVWNQPVLAYKYTYFNPQTLKNASSLSSAKVDIAGFSKDKFKKYRSPKTKSVVGISMDLTYVSETMPTQTKKDSAPADATTVVTYIYDLELDAQGNIIGGEWYQNAHPDFLWTPAPGARAATFSDTQIKKSDWTSKTQPIPAAWQALAKRASREGQPLAAVVESLITFSNRVR
jgi:hypothetical protein